MKFIHTADLHLDREFEGLVQEVAYQPYKILEKIIDFAIAEAVEVVFFAGDNFHQSQPSIKIQNYFSRCCSSSCICYHPEENKTVLR